MLSSVEDRERKVLGAEQALASDRELDKRELAQRLGEAQAAVRKLQAECEHQLAMERDRTAEAARQRDAAEGRLAVRAGGTARATALSLSPSALRCESRTLCPTPRVEP